MHTTKLGFTAIISAGIIIIAIGYGGACAFSLGTAIQRGAEISVITEAPIIAGNQAAQAGERFARGNETC